MDQFKKSTSLSILRKMHFFSKQLFSHYLKMEKCPKTMEGLFQSSRVIRIGGPYFPIRTCMQNFSQILRVQFEKSPKLFFEGRVSFMPKPAGAPTPPPKRALNAYGARPPSKAGVPPQSGVSPESLDPSICAVAVSLFSFHTTHRQKTQRNRLTQMSWRSLELQSAGNCRAI